MKRCHLLQEDFPLYLYGELPQARSMEILEHLSGCPGCLAEVDRLRDWMGEVRRISEVGGSPTFWRDYRRELRRRLPRKESDKVRVWIRNPALLIPMAFVFGIVLTVLLTRNSPSTFDSQGGAAPEPRDVAAAGETLDLIENLGMFEDLNLLERMDDKTDLPNSSNEQSSPGKPPGGAERVNQG
ncbi:MAG TPA: zf-HC2 domain-containing protein [Nitrospiria bacterium]|nr:zf-HC2 domain-containing protein [Nitrospiria bacterium]